MVEPSEVVESESSVAEKIGNLKIEKKYAQTKKDLVLELTSRDDAIDQILEQYEKVIKELMVEVEERYRIGDIELRAALNNLLERRNLLDWLNSQKERAYLKFIERICGKVE